MLFTSITVVLVSAPLPYPAVLREARYEGLRQSIASVLIPLHVHDLTLRNVSSFASRIFTSPAVVNGNRLQPS